MILKNAKTIAWMVCLVCVFATSLDSVNLFGQEQPSSSFVAKGERGLTGSYEFTYSGKPLQAKSERNNEAPISIRLIRSSRDGTSYHAKFVGTVEGTYDLREHLEHVDGSSPSGLSNMLVHIYSTLPNDHRSDLFETGAFKPSLFGGYRLSMWLLGLAWIGIPIFIFVRRAMRKEPVRNLEPIVAAPTLAEQLYPLVEAAASRSLTIREKGRLELLLYHHWRERAELKSTDMAMVIRQLRSHPEAGPLIGTLERWLHESDTLHDQQDRSPEAIVELLRPYRGQPALREPSIPEAELASRGMQTASVQRVET